MTLETEKGLILFEQVIGHRAVCIMADGAVLKNRGMLKNKRALFVGMALEA